MRWLHRGILISALVLLAGALQAAPLSRARALQSLGQAEPAQRLAGVDRLAEIGRGPDADRVAVLLADADPQVREAAATAMWLIWSRSGDAAIDARFKDGVGQMQAGALDDALATFNEIVRRRPTFAEGWNKRATVRFMLGDDEASLQDCREALKRNPLHFGALSGMAHIHLRRGDAEQALQAYTRALQANPNLEDGPAMLELLEEAVRHQGGYRI